MRSIAILVFFTWLAHTVFGQQEVATSAAAPSLVETGSGTFTTHVVTAGKALNAFVPDSLTASKGDIIQFQFFPPNHSVVRAEYGQPCIPYEDTGMNKVGFFSGFFPLDKILDNPPTWNLTIKDTDPIFFYCAAPGSCINYQMVGVINPNSSVSLATQKQDASEAQYMLAPGQDFPSEGGVPQGDVSPPGVGNSSTGSATAPPTSGSPPSYSSTSYSSGLSKGAIAGIAIAGAIGVLLFGILLFILGRQKTMLQFMKPGHYQQAGPHDPPENQHVWSQPSTMSYPPCPAPSSAIPFAGTAKYHDSPPYSEHPVHALPMMAELPSPSEKKSQMYGGGDKHPLQRDEHRNAPSPTPSPSATPQPQSRQLSCGGSRISTKTRTSELSAGQEAKEPSVRTSRYQPK